MKYIYGFCLIVGLFLIIGSAGGCDTGTLSLFKAAWYCIGGLLIALVGVAGLKGAKE